MYANSENRRGAAESAHKSCIDTLTVDAAFSSERFLDNMQRLQSNFPVIIKYHRSPTGGRLKPAGEEARRSKPCQCDSEIGGAKGPAGPRKLVVVEEIRVRVCWLAAQLKRDPALRICSH